MVHHIDMNRKAGAYMIKEDTSFRLVITSVHQHWCCRAENWVRRALLIDSTTYRRWSVSDIGRSLVRANKLGLKY